MKLATLTLAAAMAATSASAEGEIVFDYFIREMDQYTDAAGRFSIFPDERNCEALNARMANGGVQEISPISYDFLGAANWTRIGEEGNTILSTCMEMERVRTYCSTCSN